MSVEVLKISETPILEILQGEEKVLLSAEVEDEGGAVTETILRVSVNELQEIFAKQIGKEVITELSPTIEEIGDVDTYEMELLNNHVTSMGIVSESLTVAIGEAQNHNHTSVIYFTTPDTIPENYTIFPEIIHFKGNGTSAGAFTPEARMRYTIIFDYNGENVTAYVSGVRAI